VASPKVKGATVAPLKDKGQLLSHRFYHLAKLQLLQFCHLNNKGAILALLIYLQDATVAS